MSAWTEWELDLGLHAVLVSVWVWISVAVTVLVAASGHLAVLAGLACASAVPADGGNVDHAFEGIVDLGGQVNAVVAYAEDAVGGDVETSAPSMALTLTLLGLRRSPHFQQRMWQKKAEERQKSVTAKAVISGKNSTESYYLCSG